MKDSKTFKFEYTDFKETKEETIHELLSLAIHEQNQQALDKLTEIIFDIIEVK